MAVIRLGKQINGKMKTILYNYGRNRFIKIMKQCRNKMASDQLKLESEFRFELLKEISINIWDEIKNKETFLQIETPDIPNKTCADILIFILFELKRNIRINTTGIDFNIEYYDSIDFFPELIDGDTPHFYQVWKIRISNIKEEDLNTVIEELRSLSYNNIPIDIYSES